MENTITVNTATNNPLSKSFIGTPFKRKNNVSSLRKYLAKRFQHQHSINFLKALNEVEEIRKGNIKATTFEEFLEQI